MRDEAFERLYDEHAQGLFAFLLYRTGDRPLAQDLVADAFERVLRARRRFDPRKGSEKNWIYSIALNLLRDHLRRSRVEGRALARLGSENSPEQSRFDSVETSDEVRRALSSLSEAEREAIALRFGADLTLPEIARVTDQRLATIRGRMYRGMEKLRQELGD
jgi:RNA polymerase sigma factor (sigma-70 family)